jgi:hypothetical protein
MPVHDGLRFISLVFSVDWQVEAAGAQGGFEKTSNGPAYPARFAHSSWSFEGVFTWTVVWCAFIQHGAAWRRICEGELMVV